MTDLLTTDEMSFIKDLGSMWGRLCDIIGDGPSRQGDLNEAVIHIHGLQQMVMSQAAGRAYPQTFRLLGDVLRDENDCASGDEDA